MGNMTKENMRSIACAMLVDMAADGVDIKGMSSDLRDAYTFGNDNQFRLVCKEIGETYKVM